MVVVGVVVVVVVVAAAAVAAVSRMGGKRGIGLGGVEEVEGGICMGLLRARWETGLPAGSKGFEEGVEGSDDI